MPYTITRTDDTIRLDLLDDLDAEGRPGSHRVFEYALAEDPAFCKDDGTLRADNVLAGEVRKRAREQRAAEGSAADAVEAPESVAVASGERL